MPHVICTKIRANTGKTLRSARTAGVNYVDGIRATVCVALACILDR